MVAADPLNGRINFGKFNEESAVVERSFAAESLCSDEEDGTYDPTIISIEDASWSLDIQCLGSNEESPAPSKIFISGNCHYADYGDIDVESGSDPSGPDQVTTRKAYQDVDDEGPVFPFHPKCFELFKRIIAFRKGLRLKAQLLPDGDWELNTSCLEIDKDLLMGIFLELWEGESHALDISYGEPPPPQDQYWIPNSGEELFIADPGKRNDLVVNAIHDKWHAMDYQHTESLTKPSNDPFAQLPLELLLIITSALQPRPLLNLLHASGHVRRRLDHNISFWRQRFEDDMPWFYEIHSFLYDLLNGTDCDAKCSTTSPDTSWLAGQSLPHFFAWADYTTKPRLHFKGPFMGIANRRRIWGVCKQVVDPYLTGLRDRSQPGDTSAKSDDEA